MSEDLNSVTIHQYDDAFIKKLLKHAEKGGSITSFRGKEGITEKTLIEWRDNNPNFRDALEVAKCKEYAFWERQIREAFIQTETELSFDETGESGLPIEKRINIAFNMIKLQQQQHLKVTGRSLTDGNISEDEIDPTEFGSASSDLDITQTKG